MISLARRTKHCTRCETGTMQPTATDGVYRCSECGMTWRSRDNMGIEFGDNEKSEIDRLIERLRSVYYRVRFSLVAILRG